MSEINCRGCFELGTACGRCPQCLREKAKRELRPIDASVFIKLTELVGELSWGIDLPSPMTVHMQAINNYPDGGELPVPEPQKVYAVDPKNYEPVFDAIYQKLKKDQLYTPFENMKQEVLDQRSENQKLREALKFAMDNGTFCPEAADKLCEYYRKFFNEDY